MRTRIMDAWWSSCSSKVDAQRLVRKPPRSRVTCTAIFTITTSLPRSLLLRSTHTKLAVQINAPPAETKPLRLRGLCFGYSIEPGRGVRFAGFERRALPCFEPPHHICGGASKERVGQPAGVIHLTAGDIGTARPEVNSGKSYSPTLADILSHELGQLDADWYHGGQGAGDRVADGDAVRMEDQT